MNKEGLKECVHNQKSSGVKEMYKKKLYFIGILKGL